MSNAQAAHICPTRGWRPANAAALDRTRAGGRMRANSIVNLADILEMAVAFNRNVARNRDVRLHCYSLDQLPVQGEEYALLDVLDRVIGSAVRDALWSSLVVCEAGLSTSKTVVRIRYARPSSDCDASAITWTEVIRTWPRGEKPQSIDTR
jgi:hypothetical protein